MDDAVRVQVLKSVYDLHSVALHLDLVQPLPPPQQLIHALIVTELQQYVNVLCILEEVLKLDNM